MAEGIPMSDRRETRCLSIEEIDRFLADGGADDAIARHLSECSDCSGQLALVKANNRFLAGLGESRHRVRPATAAAPVRDVSGYEIRQEIYRGGQGVIYEAVHGATKRTVALKVLLAGALATTRQRNRFEREIEIVGGLQHPNVVTVYDSGTTQDGRHFFAMELIDGVPLDEHLRQRGPRSVERVLELFRQVCAGVAYAHRCGVIHRDLKPANILVDRLGHARILDFGLAKSFGDDGAVATARRITVTGEFMGTLAYASPEQVSGEPGLIDVRTDVYSLGVILYEMLTGRSPYPVTGRLDEVVKSIAETQPRSPSSWYRRARRSKTGEPPGRPAPLRVGADTGTVVLKALAKRPDDRYESVSALAADVDRLLTGRPISARPDSHVYVLWKAVTRHPGWSSAAALAIVSLVIVAFGAVVVASQRRAIITGLREQAQLREHQLSAADARREALTYYYQAIDLIGRGVRRDDALEMIELALEVDPGFSAAYLQRGLLVLPGRISGIGARPAESQAARMASYRENLREAFADFERAHRLAGGDWLLDPASGHTLTPAQARALPAGQDDRLLDFPDVLRRTDGTLVRIEPDGRRTPVGGPGLPRALFSAGNVMMSHLLHRAARTEYDTVLAEEMLGYYRRAALLDPDDVYTRLSPAVAAAAQPALQADAIEQLNELARDPQAAALVELWYAQAEVYLGGPRRLFPEYHPQWDPVGGERAARRAVELAPHDDRAWYLLGVALRAQGRYREAVAANRRALELQQRPTAPPDSDTRAKVLYNLATCHARLRQFDLAWPLYSQAFETSGHSPIVLLQRCNAWLLAGMPRDARADLEQALDIVRRRPNDRLPNLVLPAAWSLLTVADPELRDPVEAARMLRLLRERPIMAGDPAVVTLQMYAEVAAGDPGAAIALLSEIPGDALDRPMTAAVLSLAYAALGDNTRAADLWDRAERIASRSHFVDPYLKRLLERTQR